MIGLGCISGRREWQREPHAYCYRCDPELVFNLSAVGRADACTCVAFWPPRIHREDPTNRPTSCGGYYG